jgi:hypothetical protein
MSDCGSDRPSATLHLVNRDPQGGFEMQKKSTFIAALVGAAALAPSATAALADGGLLGPPAPAPSAGAPTVASTIKSPVPVPPIYKAPTVSSTIKAIADGPGPIFLGPPVSTPTATALTGKVPPIKKPLPPVKPAPTTATAPVAGATPTLSSLPPKLPAY